MQLRRHDRVVGVVYIVVACVSMTMSCIHLITTGIANTFDNYVFHIGLWLMLVGVVVSVTMACVSLGRKDIARHMGWQAMGFGFLLTAPFQRLDWLALAPFAGDASFLEMNILVNVMLFVQATLVGYALFLANRAATPLRPDVTWSGKPMSPTSKRVGFVLLIGLSMLWLLPAFASGDLSRIGVLQRMVPHDALALLVSVVHGGSLLLSASALTLLMAAGWIQLQTLRSGVIEASFVTQLTRWSGVVVIALALMWGYQLGLPTQAQSIAGSGFATLGLLLALFLILQMSAQRKGEIGKAVEWLQFLLLCAMYPALMLISLWGLDLAAAVPQPYLGNGDGYEDSFTVALFVPVAAGFILSVYSDETRRYSLS